MSIPNLTYLVVDMLPRIKKPFEDAFSFGTQRFYAKYGTYPTVLVVHPEVDTTLSAKYDDELIITIIQNDFISKKSLYFGRPGCGL